MCVRFRHEYWSALLSANLSAGSPQIRPVSCAGRGTSGRIDLVPYALHLRGSPCRGCLPSVIGEKLRVKRKDCPRDSTTLSVTFCLCCRRYRSPGNVLLQASDTALRPLGWSHYVTLLTIDNPDVASLLRDRSRRERLERARVGTTDSQFHCTRGQDASLHSW